MSVSPPTCARRTPGSAASIVRGAILLAAGIGVLLATGAATASPGSRSPRVIHGSNALAGAWPGIAYLEFIPSSVPSGIAVDADGNVYTSNYAAGTVSRITPGTPATVTDAWAAPGGVPLAIAIDVNSAGTSDDVVYVANADDTVTAFDANGTPIWSRPTGSTPAAIALDAAGNVYTANYAADTVTKITPGGVATTFAQTGSGPYAVAVDGSGNVYTANQDEDTVTKITAAGTPSLFAATGSEPSGIAIDAAGVVYTANRGSNDVTRITTGGTPSLFAATGAGPTAIAIDDGTLVSTSDDVIYTANATARNVTRITSAGTPSPFATTGARPVAIVVDATGIVYTADQAGSTVTKVTAAGTTTADWAVLGALGASCTASVIAPAVILTAAHCTVDKYLIPAIRGVARPGVVAANDTDTQRLWDLDDLLVHPGYNPVTIRNDVALVVLDRSTGAPAMPLIAPWQDGLVTGGASVDIAGWGRMTPGGISGTTALQEATVPVVSDADCLSDLPESSRSMFDPASMLCAYDLPAGIGVCSGDSGGPLSLTVAGTRTLIGVASWVAWPCASGPSVYSRVSAFRSWILNDLSAASALVRSHLMSQNAAARNLQLRSTGPDVTLTWGVTPANWTTTGFRVTINGSVQTVTGPVAARTVQAPAGGVVSATVEPQVTLGTATAATINVEPIPTRAPIVSADAPAKPRVGRRLTVAASSDDPWSGALTYQWLVNGAAVPGATTATYRPLARQAGKRLSVRIEAANAVGTGTTTVFTGRVRQAPQVATGPVAVVGTAVVGSRLQSRPTAVRGFPQPEASYRWFSNGRHVPGATGAAYRVRPADAGALITGSVTWTNEVGTVTRALRPVAIVG